MTIDSKIDFEEEMEKLERESNAVQSSTTHNYAHTYAVLPTNPTTGVRPHKQIVKPVP